MERLQQNILSRRLGKDVVSANVSRPPRWCRPWHTLLGIPISSLQEILKVHRRRSPDAFKISSLARVRQDVRATLALVAEAVRRRWLIDTRGEPLSLTYIGRKIVKKAEHYYDAEEPALSEPVSPVPVSAIPEFSDFRSGRYVGVGRDLVFRPGVRKKRLPQPATIHRTVLFEVSWAKCPEATKRAKLDFAGAQRKYGGDLARWTKMGADGIYIVGRLGWCRRRRCYRAKGAIAFWRTISSIEKTPRYVMKIETASDAKMSSTEVFRAERLSAILAGADVQHIMRLQVDAGRDPTCQVSIRGAGDLAVKIATNLMEMTDGDQKWMGTID